MLADGLRVARVERGRLGQVRLAVLGRPVRGRVDVVLPRGVGHQGALGAQGVEQRAHHRLGAPDHPADRAHARVDHRDAALPDPQAPQVPGERGAGHGALRRGRRVHRHPSFAGPTGWGRRLDLRRCPSSSFRWGWGSGAAPTLAPSRCREAEMRRMDPIGVRAVRGLVMWTVLLGVFAAIAGIGAARADAAVITYEGSFSRPDGKVRCTMAAGWAQCVSSATGRVAGVNRGRHHRVVRHQGHPAARPPRDRPHDREQRRARSPAAPAPASSRASS